MDAVALIDKYYINCPGLRELMWIHSRQVSSRCLKIASLHPELNIDMVFLEEAALLHDIGILRTKAPKILCLGDAPYICHGYLGAEMLRAEGYPRHARVCERHTGTGLRVEDIIAQNLPLPHRDFSPETIEEQLICYADKFYSKSHPRNEKSMDAAYKSVAKYGEESAARFRHWMELFSENDRS